MINETKILELIKRQKETGLTITAFCVNEGIPKSSYYYWRKRLNKVPVKGFIPLLVNTTPATISESSKSFTRELDELPKSGDEYLLELLGSPNAYCHSIVIQLSFNCQFDGEAQ